MGSPAFQHSFAVMRRLAQLVLLLMPGLLPGLAEARAGAGYALVSDDFDRPGETREWGNLILRYAFVDAVAALGVTLSQASLRLVPDGADSVEIALKNTGCAPVDDLRAELLPAIEGGELSSWIRLAVPAASIEIGDTVRLALTGCAPAAPVSADRDYWLVVRVTGDGLAHPYDIPVRVTLAAEGRGAAGFHAIDPYYKLMLRGGQSFGRLLVGRSRRDRRRLPRGARGGLGETALPKNLSCVTSVTN